MRARIAKRKKKSLKYISASVFVFKLFGCPLSYFEYQVARVVLGSTTVEIKNYISSYVIFVTQLVASFSEANFA